MSLRCSLTVLNNLLARCDEVLVIPNFQSTVADRIQCRAGHSPNRCPSRKRMGENSKDLMRAGTSR
jgi:hypothetical protein